MRKPGCPGGVWPRALAFPNGARLLAYAIPFLLLTSLIPPHPLAAQDRMSWQGFTTIGYSGLGCGAGYLLSDELDRETDLSGRRLDIGVFGVIGGCLIGGAIGLKLGKDVDAKLAVGEELTTAMRRGVQLGTVLTGTTVGTLLALLPAQARDDGKTEVVVAGALIGAAGGLIAQLALNKHLYPKGNPPALALGVGPAGGISMAAVVRF